MVACNNNGRKKPGVEEAGEIETRKEDYFLKHVFSLLVSTSCQKNPNGWNGAPLVPLDEKNQ